MPRKVKVAKLDGPMNYIPAPPKSLSGGKLKFGKVKYAKSFKGPVNPIHGPGQKVITEDKPKKK